MKHFYTLLLLFVANAAFSQFTHLKPNEEVPEEVLLVKTDGSSMTGHVRNNKMDYVLLRILSQDVSSFKHANVEVDKIRFKPEGNTDYQEIPINEIKYIILQTEKPQRYDRINVYRFKRKTLELKDKEPAMMMQTPLVDDFIVMYANFYFNMGQNGAVHDKYNIFVRLKDSDKTYYMNFMPVVKNHHNFPLLKILAPNNKKFTDYIDKLSNKKSAENKEYHELEDALMEELKAYFKAERKNLSILDQKSITANEKYKLMFSFISKKLESFSD